MKNRLDIALLQLRAMQEVRKILDQFYMTFEGQGVEENGILQGDMGRYMGERGAEDIREPVEPFEPGEGQPPYQLP